MKNLIFSILLLSTPALAESWVQAPSGKIPAKVTEVYASEELCGGECVEISEAPDLEVAKVVGKKAVPDEDKFEARETQRAADSQVAKGKKDERKAILKNLSKVKDKDVQDVLKSIIDELNLAD